MIIFLNYLNKRLKKNDQKYKYKDVDIEFENLDKILYNLSDKIFFENFEEIFNLIENIVS